MRSRHFKTWFLALALLATTLTALMPTVSRLLAARAGPVWVLVCSSDGVKLLNIEALNPADDGGAHHHGGMTGDACDYCMLLHHVPVVLDAGSAGFLPKPACEGLRLALPVYTAPHLPAPVDLPHRPRGPPLRA